MARSLATNRSAAVNRVSIQPFNASLSFNGTSSLMTSAVVPAPTGFSFGLWLKLPSVYNSGNNRYISYESALSTDGFNLSSVSGISERLFFNVYNGASNILNVGTTVGGALPTGNQWIHLACDYTPSAPCHIYLNGVLQNTSTSTGTMSAAGVSMTFFKRAFSAVFIQGQASNFVFHNTATPWTAAQVLALYQNGTIPSGATQVLPLTEGVGTVAYDTSGNANNGTITAGTYTSDVPSKKRGLVGGNLVYNGDFEYAPPSGANVATTTGSKWLDGTAAGSSTNGLFGWALYTATGSAAALIDSSTSNSGRNSIKVSTTATASLAEASNIHTVADLALGFGIPALPSTSYTLTGWMKTTVNSGAATTGARFQVIERSPAGGTQATNSTVGVPTTTGWTPYTLTFTTASGTRFLTPKLQVVGNDGTGTLIMDAWFDDIVLTPTTNTSRSLV